MPPHHLALYGKHSSHCSFCTTDGRVEKTRYSLIGNLKYSLAARLLRPLHRWQKEVRSPCSAQGAEPWWTSVPTSMAPLWLTSPPMLVYTAELEPKPMRKPYQMFFSVGASRARGKRNRSWSRWERRKRATELALRQRRPQSRAWLSCVIALTGVALAATPSIPQGICHCGIRHANYNH